MAALAKAQSAYGEESIETILEAKPGDAVYRNSTFTKCNAYSCVDEYRPA